MIHYENSKNLVDSARNEHGWEIQHEYEPCMNIQDMKQENIEITYIICQELYF